MGEEGFGKKSGFDRGLGGCGNSSMITEDAAADGFRGSTPVSSLASLGSKGTILRSSRVVGPEWHPLSTSFCHIFPAKRRSCASIVFRRTRRHSASPLHAHVSTRQGGVDSDSQSPTEILLCITLNQNISVVCRLVLRALFLTDPSVKSLSDLSFRFEGKVGAETEYAERRLRRRGNGRLSECAGRPGADGRQVPSNISISPLPSNGAHGNGTTFLTSGSSRSWASSPLSQRCELAEENDIETVGGALRATGKRGGEPEKP